MNLLETIARLFGTSMHLQKTVEQAEELIANEDVTIEELQHMRAELTALIGDLYDYQQSFVEALANAVSYSYVVHPKTKTQSTSSKRAASSVVSICAEGLCTT